MKARRKPTAGFTLVEIITVLVIAAIVFPALILPFREGVRDLEKPVIAGTLALLAQQEMETRVVAVESFPDVAGWSEAPLPEPFSEYSSQGVVDPNVSFGPVQAGLKKVTVTVTHNSGQSLSLVTVKSNWRMDQ